MAIQVISAPAATTPQAVREFVIPGSSCLHDERRSGFSTSAANRREPVGKLARPWRGASPTTVIRRFVSLDAQGPPVIGYLAPPLFFDQEASE
jgi:hypothetical protein